LQQQQSFQAQAMFRLLISRVHSGYLLQTLLGSLVPVILRYVNKKDPAFGIVAEQATGAVTEKLKAAK
jgi:hypothetical protein